VSYLCGFGKGDAGWSMSSFAMLSRDGHQGNVYTCDRFDMKEEVRMALMPGRYETGIPRPVEFILDASYQVSDRVQSFSSLPVIEIVRARQPVGEPAAEPRSGQRIAKFLEPSGDLHLQRESI
jgi:hypothetical protein